MLSILKDNLSRVGERKFAFPDYWQKAFLDKYAFILSQVLEICTRHNFSIKENQGWEFAHWFSGRIARFLPKNERMSDSLKKMSDSLICSFLVSDLSESLMVAHFW